MIKVFGHQSPDTDATASAIVWSWYLNEKLNITATPYVLGSLNKETEFVLKKWGVSSPELLTAINSDDEVVIVDTNNPQELFPNINEANITHIIDHHKLAGGLNTDKPLRVDMRPLASTGSLMYELMGLEAKDLPESIAGLILSCILSDTLGFRSPTTTDRDKQIAHELAHELSTELDNLATEMFTAKSDISSFSDEELIKLDSKKYPLDDLNLRISVIETTNPEMVLDRHATIIEAINKITESEADTDEILFFIVDILNEEATVITYNQQVKDIIAKSFQVEAPGDLVKLPGIVSRKKQIVPNLKL
jgi:manganese-dependent inorganic pyrophosphatase